MELKLYELLGIRFFQKLVFILEKIIHWKDKKQNQNYHFSNKGKEKDFERYLLYNASIHIRNIVILTGYFFLKAIFWKLTKGDVIIGLFFLKDVYCVMLQRYNYLRIKDYVKKREKIHDLKIDKQIKRINKNERNIYEVKYKEEDLILVYKLINAIEGKEYLVLTEKDEKSLERLNQLLYENGGETYGDW